MNMGFLAVTPTGLVQIDGINPNYYVSQTGSVVLTMSGGSYLGPWATIPVGADEMLFINCPNPSVAITAITDLSSVTVTATELRTSTQVVHFIRLAKIGPDAVLPSSGFGLNIYNASGGIVFSSLLPTIEIQSSTSVSLSIVADLLASNHTFVPLPAVPVGYRRYVSASFYGVIAWIMTVTTDRPVYNGTTFTSSGVDVYRYAPYATGGGADFYMTNGLNRPLIVIDYPI